MFKFQASQFAALRKKKVTAKLIELLEASGQSAEVEPSTGALVARDARGKSRRLEFDTQGFLGQVVSPLGRRWSLTNTPEGRLASLTTPSGFKVAFDYTPEGRPATVWQGDLHRLQLKYDANGNPSHFVHPDQTATLFEWLTPGRPLRITNRLGHSTRFEYDDAALAAVASDKTTYPVAPSKSNRVHAIRTALHLVEAQDVASPPLHRHDARTMRNT